jgi:hypothetical protein
MIFPKNAEARSRQGVRFKRRWPRICFSVGVNFGGACPQHYLAPIYNSVSEKIIAEDAANATPE